MHTSSLRAQFSVAGSEFNQLHGSANPDEAEKEIDFFFPVEKTLAVIKPRALDEKGWLHLYLTLTHFSTRRAYCVKDRGVWVQDFYGQGDPAHQRDG